MNATPNKNRVPRPPVIVVMGHVDHGKTTLLDYIRKTNTAEREAGGITQSIGAYEIAHKGKRATFIDTPGHEAFSAMRSRGATVADLAILVVAADDGVKPQTKEAIQTLRASSTPFIVALTKTDKPEANVEKTKNELTAESVLLEGYGGSVSCHAISAKTGEGVDELLDLALLTAELEELTCDTALPGSGFVLEVRRDDRRGIEASVIIKDGTLRIGEEIKTLSAKGKVKILENFLGERMKELIPSSPARIVGFESLPHIGEVFVTGSELPQGAGEVSPIAGTSTGQSPAEKNALPVVLRAHDAGSLEVLGVVIGALREGERTILVLDQAVGDVTDADVKRAIAGGAVVVGFKNRATKSALSLAETHHISIVTSPIIYELVKAIEARLADTGEPDTVGELEVLAVFNQEKLHKQLVGGKVAQGVFRSKASFIVRRGNETLGNGRVVNLQSQKKDANQVPEGNEAGLIMSSDVTIQVGDRLVIRKS